MTDPAPDNLPTPGRPRLPTGALSTAAAVVLCGVLVATLVVPVLIAIASGFSRDGSFSLYWFGRVLGNEVLLGQLFNSLLLACITTAVAMVIAVPMALLQTRCRFRGQGVLALVILAPMILPPFVGALSMRRLLSRFGSLNLLLDRIGVLDFAQSLPPDWLGAGLAGVVLLQVLHLFPILYLNASAASANVDPSYAQAARNLGAGPVRTFFKVTLPLMRPGLFAGGTIVFIWSFTDVGTPLILGYQHLTPVTIFKELARAEGGRTYGLVFILLSSSVTLYILGKFVFGRAAAATAGKATTAAETRRLGPVGTLGAWLLFGGVLALALAPHVGVVLMAVSRRWVNTVLPSEYTFEHLTFVVTHPATYRSILNSLKYAGLSTGIDTAMRITLPLIAANIIAGAVLTFAFAMLEVSDSLILAQKQAHYPITKQIYILATSAGAPETVYQAAALGLFGMALLGGTLALAAALLGKRLGAIFRA